MTKPSAYDRHDRHREKVNKNAPFPNAIQRSTFLFDPGGTLVRVWPKVTVLGHADEVLQELAVIGRR
jgi:peroxiredoxin